MKARSFFAIVALTVMPGLAMAGQLEDGVAALKAENYTEAMGLFLPLANSGNDEAQRLIGEMIFKEQGAEKNPAAVFAWTRLSAEAGNRIGQYNLGYLYEQGFGVTQSQAEAINWYKRSGEQEYAPAQRRLGEIFDSADNIVAASMWYNRAKKYGDEYAFQRAKELEAIMAVRFAAERAASRAAQEAEDAERQAIARAERAAEQAEYEEVQRRIAEARPSGNVIAQGIAEGLRNFQRDSARVSAIHNQAMADIHAQQADRLRREREQAARQRAQDDRNRQIAADQRRAALAAEAAAQARSQQALSQSVTAPQAPAARPAERVVAAPGPAVASSAPQASSTSNTPATSPGTRLLPVQSWTHAHLFTSVVNTDSEPKTETEARRQVSAARARREKEFGEWQSRYKQGGYGLASWRVARDEPVECSNQVSYNRPYVRCTQRVDYAVVSTDAPVSEVQNYGY